MWRNKNYEIRILLMIITWEFKLRIEKQTNRLWFQLELEFELDQGWANYGLQAF